MRPKEEVSRQLVRSWKCVKMWFVLVTFNDSRGPLYLEYTSIFLRPALLLFFVVGCVIKMYDPDYRITAYVISVETQIVIHQWCKIF